MTETYAMVRMILAANITKPAMRELLEQLERVSEEVRHDARQWGIYEGYKAAQEELTL